jgi:hypothetical protein
MLGHHREPVDRSTAAGEYVNRPGAQRGDQPVQVVRVLLRRGLCGAVGPLAAPDPRGSYVTTVRSRKYSASVVNPLASIGDPIISSTGAVVSASASRMS